MSTFAIYKSNSISLKSIGIINKIVYILFALVAPGFIFSGTLISTFSLRENVLLIPLYFTGFIIIVLISYSFYIRRNLKQLGDIKIHKQGVTKSIGGIIDAFEFDSVKEFIVKKHMYNIFFSQNGDGSKTYLVTLKYHNNSQERFVISGLSIDKPQVNFIKTIRKIEKVTGKKIKVSY